VRIGCVDLSLVAEIDGKLVGHVAASPVALVLPGVPTEYFLALAFGDSRPQGNVACHRAFDATA